MGYNIIVLETNFRVVKENTDAVLATLKSFCQSQPQNYAFVQNDVVLKASDIYDALAEWRWLPLIDDEGNVEDLEFTGEKLGGEQVLFDAIAPFVEAGSYIVAARDDGRVWRWRFNAQRCFYEVGKIVF